MELVLIATGWAPAAMTLVNAVPFVYRYHAMAAEARYRVRSGAIGPVRLMHGHYLQDWLLRATDDNWRVDAAAGGSSRAFADIGSHWCDLVEWVTGHRISELTAVTQTVHPERTGGVAVSTEDVVHVAFRTDLGRCVVHNRICHDIIWQWHRAGQARGDVGFGFASAHGQPLGKNMRRRGDFDDPHREARCRLGDDGARHVRHHHNAARQVIGDIGGNAVAQAVRLPAQCEVPGRELGFGDGFVVLAGRIGGPRNNPPDETKPRIAGQRPPHGVQQRVLARAARPHHQHQHFVSAR